MSTLALVAIAACSRGEPPAGSDTPPPATYEIRGLVRAFEGGELTVHHEPVPDLVGPTGEVEPMGTMTMTFPVDGDAASATLAPGDKISFLLAVDWGAEDPARVTAIDVLPTDTGLVFD